MVRERFKVDAKAEPPERVIEEALKRQREADGNEPLRVFLRDHVDFEIEWILPEGVTADDSLRCIS